MGFINLFLIQHKVYKRIVTVVKIVCVQINWSEDDICKLLSSIDLTVSIHNNANSFSTKKFPAFYETWGFITMFIRAHDWSVPWPDESSPILLSCILRSILMLCSHLHFSIPSSLFLKVFLQNLCTHFSSPPCMLCAPPSSSSSYFLPTFRVCLLFSHQAQQLSCIEHLPLPGHSVTAAVLSAIIKATLSTFFCHVLCKFVALKM